MDIFTTFDRYQKDMASTNSMIMCIYYAGDFFLIHTLIQGIQTSFVKLLLGEIPPVFFVGLLMEKKEFISPFIYKILFFQNE
jgi:hypothetical protein